MTLGSLSRAVWRRLPARVRSTRATSALKRTVMRPPPFGGPPGEDTVPVVTTLDERVFDRFEPYTGPGEAGYMVDFLGGRTRTSYLRGYEEYDGTVISVPERAAPFLHEHDEWLGALASVVEARERGELAAFELGAGWGPWLVSCALAAQQLGGIRSIRLVGVEASASHHAMMLTHFRDNGLDQETHRLVHGVVRETRGVVHFPRLPDPAADWGPSELAPESDLLLDRLGRRFEEFDEVPALTLDDLVMERTVDFVHMDIQGSEESVIPAGMPCLSEWVRRVVVGTHGRRLDREISNVFSAAGWIVEARQPSILTPEGALLRDGVQVWRNDRVP